MLEKNSNTIEGEGFGSHSISWPGDLDEPSEQ